MYKWSFIVQRDNYTWNLINNYYSKDLIFYEEGDEEYDLTYYFTSPHLNLLSDPNEVYSTASILCDYLYGIELLIHEDKNDCKKIILDDLIDIENELSVQYKKSRSVDFSNIKYQTIPPKDSFNYTIIDHIFELIKKDKFVENILFIISEGMSFNQLYSALDEVRTFLKKNNSSLDLLGFCKIEINSFTHTANSFKVLGRRSRHGTTNCSPPVNPMSIKDAQVLITNIIRKVLEIFYNIELPYKVSNTFDINDLKLDNYDF